MIDGVGAITWRETRTALWWIWMDRDGGGGSAGTMVGRRPRIQARGRRRTRPSVAVGGIEHGGDYDVSWEAWERSR